MKTTLHTLLSSFLLMLLLVNRFEAAAQCVQINSTLYQTRTPSAASQAGGTLGNWSNLPNVYGGGSASRDVSLGFLQLLNSGTTRTVTATGFGFTIPADKIINRVVITVNRSATIGGGIGLGNYVVDSYVGLTVGGNLSTGASWANGSLDFEAGGGFTPAQVNAPGFGVQLQAALGIFVGLGSSTQANLDGFSIAIYVDDSVEVPCALPVGLTSFEGTQAGSCAKLNWSTETEKNNDYFIVERASGNRFTEVGRVNSLRGSSIAPSDYELLDCNVSAVNYYRLVQVDNNGDRNIIGDLISLAMDMNLVEDVLLVPNPAHDFACVTSQNVIRGIQVLSLDGKVVYQDVPSGHTKQSCLPLSEFGVGVYTVQVETTLGVVSKRLVVQ